MKILVIQTAFIGDAILASAVLESLHAHLSDARIDMLVRKGNESLFASHPFLNDVLVWDKQHQKIKNLFALSLQVRQRKYDLVINLHRFASSGIIAWLSGAKDIRGFDKNPLSFLFDTKIAHQLSGQHETLRNQLLIANECGAHAALPRLYPSAHDYETAKQYMHEEYVCMAPSSVWFTKQLPEQKWISLTKKIASNKKVYLLGAPGDVNMCTNIATAAAHTNNVTILAGKLSLLQSAALMQHATMNYVNDSAPLHLCSAVNAPVTAFFCSTTPQFGFGPLSTVSHVVQAIPAPACKPCGIHGFAACPQSHFHCGHHINMDNI